MKRVVCMVAAEKGANRREGVDLKWLKLLWISTLAAEDRWD